MGADRGLALGVFLACGVCDSTKPPEILAAALFIGIAGYPCRAPPTERKPGRDRSSGA